MSNSSAAQAQPPRFQPSPVWLPVVVSGFLAVIGPFGTYEDLSLVQRLVYWNVAVGLNWAMVEGLLRLLMRRFGGTRGGLVRAAIATCLLAPVAGTVVVWVLEQLFRQQGPPTGPGLLYLLVLVVTVMITAPVMAFRLRGPAPQPSPAPAEMPPQAESAPDRTAPDQAAPPPQATPAESAFLRRIPAALGRDLLCLEMEDHYLRLHTALGSDLILMRLRDAEAELGGVDGQRVHRSWWVARRAVAGSSRRAGRLFLRLSNGIEVPVSRGHAPRLREAGWFDDPPESDPP